MKRLLERHLINGCWSLLASLAMCVNGDRRQWRQGRPTSSILCPTSGLWLANSRSYSYIASNQALPSRAKNYFRDYFLLSFFSQFLFLSQLFSGKFRSWLHSLHGPSWFHISVRWVMFKNQLTASSLGGAFFGLLVPSELMHTSNATGLCDESAGDNGACKWGKVLCRTVQCY